MGTYLSGTYVVVLLYCSCGFLLLWLNKLSLSPFHSNLGRAHCYPSWQRMDTPASCATSCVIPTADESNHSSMGTLHPHHSATATCILYVTLLTMCCPIPPEKEKCPFRKWRYKPSPKFPLEQWKNEIACNFAYVQTETLNFTFAGQAIIVCFYIRYNF